MALMCLLLALLIDPAWAAMYKCTDSKGRTSYQQDPCPDGTEVGSKIEVEKSTGDSPSSAPAKPFDFRKVEREYNSGNTTKAIRAYRKAAMKGNINAQMALSNIYCYSPGGKVRVSNAEAAKWSKMACDAVGEAMSCGVYKKASKGQCKQVEDKRKKYKWFLE